jgi:hypothetical protein
VQTDLEVLTLVIVAVAIVPAFAHALEFPGKRRLGKSDYLAVQPIYYPGFTVAGFAEPLGLLLLLVLLFVTPFGSAPFLLTAIALVALLAMHATYWLLTHPVNDFWLRDTKVEGLGARFFQVDMFGDSRSSGESNWTRLRDRWEFSHIVRAGFGLVALVCLAAALAV